MLKRVILLLSVLIVSAASAQEVPRLECTADNGLKIQGKLFEHATIEELVVIRPNSSERVQSQYLAYTEFVDMGRGYSEYNLELETTQEASKTNYKIETREQNPGSNASPRESIGTIQTAIPGQAVSSQSIKCKVWLALEACDPDVETCGE